MPDTSELLEDCLFEMEVEIPWDLVDEARQPCIESLTERASMPGFRRGRVPAAVVSREFESEIVRDLAREFIPHYLYAELQKRDVEYASGPYIHDIRYSEGAPMMVQAIFEVFPKFELQEYRGLPIPLFETEVTDEMVDTALGQLRIEHATYRNIDPRPIVADDIVATRVKGSLADGTEILDSREVVYRLESMQDTPEVSEALTGKVPGDTVTYKTKYSEDDPNPLISGREVTHHVDILAIREMDLPDLDDEFAKDTDADVESLEELRLTVRERLTERVLEYAERDETAAVCTELVKRHNFAIPPRYHAKRCDALIRDANRQLESTGREVPDPILKAQITAEYDEAKAELVLDRIAIVEGITTSPSEFQEALVRYAEFFCIPVEEAYERLRENGELKKLESQVRRRKVIGFLLAEADRSVAAGDDDSTSSSSQQTDSVAAE